MKRLIFALVCAVSAPAHAEVYKCAVNGKTTFTQHPGEGCQTQRLDVVPYDPAEAARTAGRLRQIDARDKQFQESETQAREERQKRIAPPRGKRAAAPMNPEEPQYTPDR